MRSRSALAMVMIALLAAVAIGCGGSSEAAPLKKPQFVQQANAICMTAQGEREAQGKELEKQGGESGGSEDTEAAMEQILEPVETMVGELSDLGPPKGEEQQVEAIVEAYEEGISALEADPGGADSVSAFDKANGLAEDYGLFECTI